MLYNNFGITTLFSKTYLVKLLDYDSSRTITYTILNLFLLLSVNFNKIKLIRVILKSAKI